MHDWSNWVYLYLFNARKASFYTRSLLLVCVQILGHVMKEIM